MSVGDWLSGKCFGYVHGCNLVYNTCWEDPRLDREALELRPQDVVLVITSAGCNVLDYLLDEPAEVIAVDLNYRQNALLELKLAGIRRLEFADFFALFGQGRSPNFREQYRQLLRVELSPRSRSFWDRRQHLFDDTRPRPSFYFHGTTGWFAWWINLYIDRVARIRAELNEMLQATTLAEQQRLYDARLREAFWGGFIRWLVGRDATLSLLGVPRPQRQEVERNYVGGIARFVEDCLEAVFTRLPLADNYFWRVYLEGRYSPWCCPEYLKPANFARLKAGLVDRVRVCTGSVADIAASSPRPISRFVLLDHMDWLGTHNRTALRHEWKSILGRATADARAIWRSGGTRTRFVDDLQIDVAGRERRLGDLLLYHREWAADLHRRDRVHTYGSFHIADLAV
ncbi:MAG: DUF3419 family protein [Pirellulales bacterium]